MTRTLRPRSRRCKLAPFSYAEIVSASSPSGSLSPLPRLPDFLVIGAMKAGTTTLYHDLRSQGGIFLPDKESNALLAEEPAKACQLLFNPAAEDVLAGEVCPDYTKPTLDRRAAAAAAHLYADVQKVPRLIYLVREPIDRLRSHHHFISNQHGDANPGGMTRDLEASLRDFPGLIETGLYAARLAPWIENFGNDAVKIVRFEDYIADRIAVLRSIGSFLGMPSISADAIQADRIYNPGDSRPVATPAWRRLMKHPLYRRMIRPCLPLGVRDRIRERLLPKPRGERPPLSQEIRRQLVERFQPDVEKLSSLADSSGTLLWRLDDHPEA